MAIVPVDPTNTAMVVLVGAGQIVTWIVMFRSGRKSEIKEAAKKAAAETGEATGITALAKANERIATTLESLDKWARNHEIADTRWQAAAEQIMKQQANSATDMTRMMEGLQRQLTNLALGIAPAEAQALPPNRRK